MALGRLTSMVTDRRLNRFLLAFFVVAFLARLCERLGYWLGMAAKPMTFNDYTITEWLINYQGGFLRRGLMGSLVLSLWEHFRVPPVQIIVVLCLAAFATLAFYLWHLAKDQVPRWVLFTTPLLGYPVFINGIMLRKDILVALAITVIFHLFIRSRFKGADWIAALIFSLLVLTHEVSFFLAFPALCCTILLRSYANRLSKQSDLQKFHAHFLTVPEFACLLMPLFTFLVVATQGPALPNSIDSIASAWRSAYNPSLPFPGPAGAIAWLAKPLQDGIACSKGTFAMLVHGVPYWLIVVLSIVSGIILLASTLAIVSPIRAWFFALAATLAYIFMLPIFYATCDHGRWVILTLLVAFVLSLQVPLHWQDMAAKLTHFPKSLETFVLPYWFAPLGLLFWGLSVVIWCPTGAPVALILQVYFYSRVLGILPKLSM